MEKEREGKRDREGKRRNRMGSGYNGERRIERERERERERQRERERGGGPEHKRWKAWKGSSSQGKSP